jgi:hypothetical protein
MTKFNKAVTAAAVSAAIAGVGAPAHAIMTGVVGEALLVPLMVFGDDDRGVDQFNTTVILTCPADFVMTGDAWVTFDIYSGRSGDGGDFTGDNSDAYIPVLAMSDGQDTPGVGPRIRNEVVYDGGNIPAAVSPIISGMRLTNGDGDQNDRVLFDMMLFASPDFQAIGCNSFPLQNCYQEEMSTLMVVWLDNNYGFQHLPVDVYDIDEDSCSASLDLPQELNTLFMYERNGVIRVKSDPTSNPWDYRGTADDQPALCFPPSRINVVGGAGADAFANMPGFVHFRIPEGLDEGPGTGATSAGVAFSILMSDDEVTGGGIPGVTGANEDVYVTLGHELGKEDL